MEKLEQFLNAHKNIPINESELEDFTIFGYDDEVRYRHHLNFLLSNCYSIDIIKNQKKRMGQAEFRAKLFERYNGACVISGNNCTDELEAAHIIPVADNESYDIDNGLVLTSTLHCTFDKYLWSINPKTLIIETHPNKNVGQITHYVGKKANIIANDELVKNLWVHYKKFKSK